MFKIKFGSEIIKEYFTELEKEKINYVVLRNYEGLPETNSSKDVDILIDEYNLIRANAILVKIANKLNYYFIWKNKLDYLTGYVFCSIVDNTIYSVKIDLFHNLKWRGLAYIENDIIFENKKKYNSLFIPNKSHESFIMILYYILYAKNIKRKYFNNIYLYKNDIENFVKISNRSLGRELTNILVEKLKTENILEILKYRNEIIQKIFTKNLKNTTLMLENIMYHLYYEIVKRNFFGVIVIFEKDYFEKDLMQNMFIDLGIGYETNDIYNFTTFNLIKLLRKNPLIVLEKDILSKFQKKIFFKRIININNENLNEIFFKIQKTKGNS